MSHMAGAANFHACADKATPSIATGSLPSAEKKADTDLKKALIETDKFDKVSKRNVERYYRSKDPQLCRNFVSKPIRRSPLLNRFYWLRTKAVDHAVDKFLQEDGKGPKLIVNLGSGSDVLPWRHQDGEPSFQAPEDIHWIDVDFPEVIKEKASVVACDVKLKTLLGEPAYTIDRPEQCFIQGSRYSLIGCDFAENAALLKKRLLECATRNGVKSRVLLVAEMSLSLNSLSAVDELLLWFKDVLHAKMCILEHKPSPISHLVVGDFLRPDADSSFDDQRARFSRLKLADAHVSELWDIWSDDRITTPDERQRIHDIEPFDDWEDFIIWTRHFALIQDCFYVEAQSASVPQSACDTLRSTISAQSFNNIRTPSLRFGDLVPVRSPEGRLALIQMFGTANGKLNTSYNVFSLDQQDRQDHVGAPNMKTWGPPPRTHFTLTNLEAFGYLLVGGSAGSKILSDSWIFRGGISPGWDLPTPIMKLPFSISRHSAVRLGHSGMALILGGLRSPGSSENPLLFHPAKGWQVCKVEGEPCEAVFGATAWCDLEEETGVFSGYLCGGLTLPGTLSNDAYKWNIDMNISQPTVSYSRCGAVDPRLMSFGASVHNVTGKTLIYGGVGQHTLGDRALFIETTGEKNPLNVVASAVDLSLACLGSAITSTDNGELVLIGGGVASFPMQRFASPVPMVHTFAITDQTAHYDRCLKALTSLNISKDIPLTQGNLSGSAPEELTIVQIPRITIRSSSEFEAILKERKPVVIEKLDFGSCLRGWNPEDMMKKVGANTQVVVHEGISDSPRMDFNAKNFKYLTDDFGKIVSRMQAGGRLYLRALSSSKPSEIPANLDDDFPALAPDFVLPPELASVQSNLFSSILRLSGRANMWLHYDVMANIYTQVGGSKRMILFPPASVTKLAFSPGASSSSLDVFDTLRNNASSLVGTDPHEANLQPGDALFLPAAWLHTAEPLTDMSVAVNVFFRDLTSGYAEGRDVYGNRDLGGYEKGRQDLKRILKGFKDVPDDLKEFYLKRLAQELEQMATSDS